ncbi:putative FBD-associated F-box protein [Cardamine amara subsp. amara]|uniref:FBD-associated F-box protein n=1 Tax=Cardamine amara subsp. amara TaxID=228776 RepID=A0ABD1BJP8_CARAN
MKNRSKITNRDKISQLPDDLLFKILSLIPIRDAMSRCLLSKRWKLVWKMMPTLDFDENSYRNIGSLGFEEFFRTSLHSHEARVLTSLNLKLSQHYRDAECQFLLIIRHILLEITIHSSSVSCSPVRFPRYLNIYKTLVVMKLQGRLVVEVSFPPVCFQSLKSLHLLRVNYRRLECLTSLLSACPILEDLFIERAGGDDGIKLFNISVPSLRRLSILELDSNHASRMCEINTPLKYLKIEDKRSRFNFVEDMPNLVEAHVKADHYETEKLLRLFSSVQRLSIHFFSSKFLHLVGTIFKQLLHLELHMHNRLHRTKILSFLKHSPNLQALKLNGKLLGSIRKKRRYVRKPSSVPKCLTFHLESLEWRGYAGRPEDKEIAAYILRNARCLKTAKVSYGKKHNLRIVKELKSLSEVLTSCQLVIQPQRPEVSIE